MRSVPSRCRRSKKNGESSVCSFPSLPKRLIVSWNARGRPSSSRARVSPSSTNARPGSARACATSSGTLPVISRRVRVQTRTSSPSRWTWMRAPSSLYSTVTSGPRPANAVSSESPGEASIGRTGRPTRRLTAASAGAPPSSARRAVSGRLPESMNARRTTAAGTSAAAAIASSITPSSAPWRSSPPSSAVRKRCSARVAAAKRSCRSSARRFVEPAPAVAASASRVASTCPTVRVGSAAGGASMPDSVRQPVPTRPCRASPASHAVAGSTSPGAAARSRAASVAALRRAGPGGPDSGGRGDDLAEQHRPILSRDDRRERHATAVGTCVVCGSKRSSAGGQRGRHPQGRREARRGTP